MAIESTKGASEFRPAALSRGWVSAAIVVAWWCLAGGVTPLRAMNATTFGDRYDVDYVPVSSTTIELYGRLHKPALSATARPLIVFFHGSGQLGEKGGLGTSQTADVDNLVANSGSGTAMNAFIYAPQAFSAWDATTMNNVMAGVAMIMRDYNIAPDQIYATGLSLGGGATWSTLMAFPIYAAGIPISGSDPSVFGGSFDHANNMVGVPIWAFHAQGDTTVPESNTRAAIDHIRESGSNPQVNSWPISTLGHAFYNNGNPYYLIGGTTSWATFLCKTVWETGSSNVPAFNSPNFIYTEFVTGGHGIAKSYVYSHKTPGVTGTTLNYPLYEWLAAQRKTVAPLQAGETIFFDFGKYSLPNDNGLGRGTDSMGRTWNCTGIPGGGNWAMGAEKTLNMPLEPSFCVTGSTGRQTLVGIRITGTFGGNTTLGGTSGMLYDGNITKDAFITTASGTAALTIYGLAPGVEYRMAIFATATNSDGSYGRMTRYQIDDGSGDNLDPVNNVNTQVVLTATASGAGAITFQVMPQPGTSSRYGMISALEISLVDTTPPTSLQSWRQLHGLPNDGSQDLDAPAGDSVSNLVKYALNMAPDSGDLARPACPMAVSGTAGLPRIDTNGQGQRVFTFVRRKAETNPEVLYFVEESGNLSGWLPYSGIPAMESIDPAWERVSCTIDPQFATIRFLRLRVARP